MNQRILGKTGWKVSEISLGTWQVGGRWGEDFSHQTADALINRAIDLGVNFIDTADVYSGGLSEAAVGRVIRSRKEKVYLATKCGRFLNPHISESYTPQALTGFVENSLKNTGLDSLDLIQLHCPPSQVYYRPEIFETFEKLKTQGKIQHLGVSVEKVEEGLKAMEYPGVATIQLIFNMFRQRPAEYLFRRTTETNTGLIVRVPLASGLLSGKMTRNTSFLKDDHRTFNRNGEAFDKGETFSGVDFETGLNAAEELKKILGEQYPLSSWALKWILQFQEVSTIIPGASRLEQLEANCAAAALPALTEAQLGQVKAVYERMIKPQVHQLW